MLQQNRYKTDNKLDFMFTQKLQMQAVIDHKFI